MALLGDARSAAERDADGGVKPEKESSSWLGAKAYLILLDQVGECFDIVGKNNADNGTSIHRSLSMFQ